MGKYKHARVNDMPASKLCLRGNKKSLSAASIPELVLVRLQKVGLVLKPKVARVLCDAILDLFRELDGVGRQRLEVRVHVIHDRRVCVVVGSREREREGNRNLARERGWKGTRQASLETRGMGRGGGGGAVHWFALVDGRRGRMSGGADRL